MTSDAGSGDTTHPAGWSELGVVARTGAVFLPAATLGTLGHELGHWGMAKLQGCRPVLHFASVSPGCPGRLGPEVEFWGVAAGPLSTLVCGSLGVLGLAWWRRRAVHLDFTGIAWTVLALFWSRPLFNTLVQLGSVALGMVPSERLQRSDEGRLSMMMEWPTMTLSWVCSLWAVGVIAWTASQVPARVRGSWAAGAVSGALAGFALWMGVLGPAWLP